jgi:hypothetical protein
VHRVQRVEDEYSARKKRNDIAWHGKEHLTDRHSKRGLLAYRHSLAVSCYALAPKRAEQHEARHIRYASAV